MEFMEDYTGRPITPDSIKMFQYFLDNVKDLYPENPAFSVDIADPANMYYLSTIKGAGWKTEDDRSMGAHFGSEVVFQKPDNLKIKGLIA